MKVLELRKKDKKELERSIQELTKKLRATEEKETLQKDLPKVISQIDKLAKKTVIHKNKAANLKSKLMKKANKAKTA